MIGLAGRSKNRGWLSKVDYQRGGSLGIWIVDRGRLTGGFSARRREFESRTEAMEPFEIVSQTNQIPFPGHFAQAA